MKRFENAQVGDLVYDEVFGDGEITTISTSADAFLLCVYFGNTTAETYTLDGYFDIRAIKPTLFYRKGDEKYLTERPKPEIDWNEYVGKMINVSNDMLSGPYVPRELYAYDPKLDYAFICFIRDSKKTVRSWQYAKPIEQPQTPEIDWSKVPSGVKVKLAGNSYGIFMAYLPHLEFPFWVFEDDTLDSAWGYCGCELAEKCKPEWIKK